MRPGDAIDEPALCERFGASRTPVREALLLLVAKGLVEIVPRSGHLCAAAGCARAGGHDGRPGRAGRRAGQAGCHAHPCAAARAAAGGAGAHRRLRPGAGCRRLCAGQHAAARTDIRGQRQRLHRGADAAAAAAYHALPGPHVREARPACALAAGARHRGGRHLRRPGGGGRRGHAPAHLRRRQRLHRHGAGRARAGGYERPRKSR